jgi:phage recombination protein Bet
MTKEVTVRENQSLAKLAHIPEGSAGITEYLSRPESIELVRNIFAKDFTLSEFAVGFALAKAMGANPFRKDIYFIKYGNQVSYPLNYLFLLKKAQEHPEYVNHLAREVWPGDKFEEGISFENGKMVRTFDHTPCDEDKRGDKPRGAYAFIWTKRSTDPYYVWVDFSSVDTGKSKWLKAPGWMVRKCALAACIRDAFSGEFTGAYIEEELDTHNSKQDNLNMNTKGLDIAVLPPKASEKPEKEVKPKTKPKTPVKEEKPEEKEPPKPKHEILPPPAEEPKVKKELTEDGVTTWAQMIGVPDLAIKAMVKKYTKDLREMINFIEANYSDKEEFVRWDA